MVALKNFQTNIISVRIFSAAVIASSCAVACGGSSENASGTKTDAASKVSFTASGTLLASADVGNGNVVEFREIPGGGGIFAMGVGPVKAPKLDYSRLVGKSVTDIYRDLSGREPPQQLVDAEESYSTRPIGFDAVDDKNLAAPQEATHHELGGINALADAWSDQATWFQNSFCTQVGTGAGGYTDETYTVPTKAWDYNWCPLNVGWAHSGWGAVQKAYYTTGAVTDSGGTLWVEKLSNGSWQRIATVNLANWTYGWANFVGVGQYRSGMDSSTGSNRIDFSERYRYAIPTISQILPNFPDNVTYANFGENPQGLTHDANNWYMTRYDDKGPTDGCKHASRGLIGTMALTGPACTSSTATNCDPLRTLYYGPSGGYYTPALENAGLGHYGDLVHVNGRLYVAVNHDADTNKNPGVAVFTTGMGYVGFGALPSDWGDNNFAGIAYNLRDGLFYSASPIKSQVWGFKITVSGSTVTVRHVRTVNLNNGVGGTMYTDGAGQGGKASPYGYGNLYWATGGSGGTFGIYAIDLINGYMQYFYSWSKGSAAEFEGLDIYDTDADTRFGAYKQGQIHLMESDPDCTVFLGGDDYWLAHARVNDPSHL